MFEFLAKLNYNRSVTIIDILLIVAFHMGRSYSPLFTGGSTPCNGGGGARSEYPQQVFFQA